MKLSNISEMRIPGTKFFRDYLAYANPNTKNRLYKMAGLNTGDEYSIDLTKDLAGQIAKRLKTANKVLKIHMTGGVIQSIGLLVGVITANPYLISFTGLAALKDLAAVLNQIELRGRLHKVNDRLLVRLERDREIISKDIQ